MAAWTKLLHLELLESCLSLAQATLPLHGVAGALLPSRGEKRTEAALSLGGVTLPRPTGTARFPYPTRSDPLIHPIDDDGRDHSPRVTKGAAARSVAFARTHGTASPSPIPQSFDLPHGFMPWQARDMPWIPAARFAETMLAVVLSRSTCWRCARRGAEGYPRRALIHPR